jgi:hypothetical protein
VYEVSLTQIKAIILINVYQKYIDQKDIKWMLTSRHFVPNDAGDFDAIHNVSISVERSLHDTKIMGRIHISIVCSL